MTPYQANPFAFIFPALLIAAVLAYVLFAAVDRLALDVQITRATVVTKQFNQAGKSYYTTIIDGRSIVQSQSTPETCVLVLNVGNERTSGMVPKMLYETVQVNDVVQVKLRRRRITKRLEVLEVTR